MSGAYTAKPEAVVAPTVPPEWNPDWAFPGPAPPGYEYDYSIVISGNDSVPMDGAYSPTSTLYDHGTYRTPSVA